MSLFLRSNFSIFTEDIAVNGKLVDDEDDPHNDNASTENDSTPEDNTDSDDTPDDGGDDPHDDDGGSLEDDTEPDDDEISDDEEDDPDDTEDETDPHDDNGGSLEDGTEPEDDEDDNTGEDDDPNLSLGDDEADPHDDGGSLEDDTDQDDGDDNTGTGGDASADPHDDDGGSLEDDANTQDDGGDDGTSDDSDNPDGEDVDQTSQQLEDKIQNVENELFDTLTDNEKQNKILKLKEDYFELYKKVTNYETSISNVEKDSDNVELFVRIRKAMADLRDYIYYYLLHNFDSLSYFENQMMFYKYMAVLNSITVILKKYNKNNEKSEC